MLLTEKRSLEAVDCKMVVIENGKEKLLTKPKEFDCQAMRMPPLELTAGRAK
jgi:hypothetical protein